MLMINDMQSITSFKGIGTYSIPPKTATVPLLGTVNVDAAYEIKNLIIPYTGYSGPTGAFNLSLGLYSGGGDYQVGDRINGVRFAVMNFNPNNTIDQTYWHFGRVGTWSSETGYTACSSDPTLQSAITGGCQSTLLWGTPGNVRPKDRADPIVDSMPLGSLYFLLG